MPLILEPYLEQRARWPQSGRHILAQYSDDAVVVYQAYKPSIGRFAAEHGYFGGEWSESRMTWIKPNFLSMMFRSRWAQKEGQEVVLAIWLRREAFDEILRRAVVSTFDPSMYESREAWQTAVHGSSVRLQWDPDHDPTGAKVERRAIQLGLRGDSARRFAREWVLGIEDVTELVAREREHATPSRYAELVTPREDVYPAPA